MDLALVVVIIFFLYFIQRRFWVERLSVANQYQLHKVGGDYFDVLFATHIGLFLVYYTYAVIKFSDSFSYYEISSDYNFWFDLWGSDTRFVAFFAWPFTHFLGLSYEATMFLFSYIGFQGIVIFYFAAKENIFGLRPITGSYSIIEYVFLLPNLHFWTASLGKGALITPAIALMVYGLARYNVRKWQIVLGGFIIYMIRPHILFAILLGVGTGMMLSRKGVRLSVKVVLILLASVSIFFISDDLNKITQNEGLNIFKSQSIGKVAADLARTARSGVDISNYNQFEKIFTFWYRPLFFDAPGVLGIIVSFENLLYLIFTINLLRMGFVSWKYWNGWYRMLLFSFLFGSIALAQVMANMGIAMRQKAQLMPMFFILYCRVMSLKGKKAPPASSGQ